mgnify:CR=1 FL=1
MDDFESENFRDILNTENLKDDAYDDLKLDDDIFDINENSAGEESDNDDISEKEEQEEESENEEVDFLEDKSDKEPRVKSRSEEAEKLENLLNDDKSKDNEFDDLMYKISSNYDKIKVLNDGDLPSVFPLQSDIKTVRHARQVYKLTNKKLNSMMVSDALTEIVPIFGDVLAFIFNGERSIFGRKPDATGYGIKLRTKMSNCNNDIGVISDKIVRNDLVASCIKLLSIFGVPFYTTLKENSDRSKQGLKKEKIIELNSKRN